MLNKFNNVHLLTIVENGTAVAGSVDTENLQSNVIYSSSDLQKEGIVLAFLDINREIDEGAVKKKIASIKKSKGVISPCLIVSAKKCIEEGLKVKLADGTEVTLETPDLDKIFVIVDGQHRNEAVRRINEDSKVTDKYECFYHLPLAGENIVVSDLLREANVSTYAWKDQQYLANLIAMKESSTIKLDLLKEIQAHPECKTKSITHWLTLDKSRTIYSRQIVEAMVDDTKLKNIAEVKDETFEIGKKLFEVFSDRLGSSEAGHIVYSDWVIDKLNYDTHVTQADAAEKIGDFFKVFITEADITTIKTVKGSRDPFTSRDTKIVEFLDAQWTKYLNPAKK